MGYQGPEREADYSPQSIAEVKNGRCIPPLPHTSRDFILQANIVHNTPVDPLGLNGESVLRIVTVTKIEHANGAREAKLVVLYSKLYLLDTVLY
jgi:hypothetical protein